MTKGIKQALFPAKSGLVGKNKPAVVLISSPYDHQNAAVRYSSTKVFLDGHGFRVINKRKISFNELPATKPLQPREKANGITVWLEAHGAPSWLFGRLPTVKSELEGTVDFANFIKQLANDLNAPIDTVVLSCCHSATEFVHEETGTYFNSPARLLSCILADVNVIGFIGTNVSAKITQVLQPVGGSLEEVIIPLEDGGVMFRDGVAVERAKRTLFCRSNIASELLDKMCSIKSEPYFEVCQARERLEERGIVPKQNCYGERQIAMLRKEEQSLESATSEMPPTEPSLLEREEPDNDENSFETKLRSM